MAIWDGEDEASPPWKTDSDELRDDLPAELASFLSQLDLTRSFLLEIQQFPNATYSGQGAIIDQYHGTIPSYEALVSLHGPQYFLWNFSWTAPAKKKPQRESVKIPLIGTKWEQLYRESKRLRTKMELEKIKMDAEERRAEAGIPMVSQGPNMTDIAALITAVKPSGDNAGMFQVMATMMQQMGQAQMNMMGLMMKAQSDMLVAVMGMQNKPVQEKNTLNEFKEIFAMVREVQSLTGAGLTQKEETLLERIVGGIIDNLDMVKEFLVRAPSGQEAGSGIVGGMIKNRPEVKEAAKVAKANNVFLQKLVAHLDKAFGDTTVTDKALDGFLDVKRPSQPSGGELPSEPEEGPQTGEEG